MKTVKVIFFLLPAIAMMAGCKKKDQPAKVKAAFQVDNAAPAVNETVNFTNQSENASYYQWDFGDDQISVDENPSHSYDTPGVYTVVLKAIGGNSSDTVSSTLTVKVPVGLITIHEGIGIDQLSIIDDTWQTMLDSFPVVDTFYYSNYYSNYNLYINQVYYYNLGIIGIFFSEGTKLITTDPLAGVILIDPYPGFTVKNISVGSKLTSVKYAYGEPESLDDTSDYLGYSYTSLGIDFYAYKGQKFDPTSVAEIDIYPAQKKSALDRPDPFHFRPYVTDVKRFRE